MNAPAACPNCGHVLHARKNLTPVQRSIYRWVARFVAKQGYAPSFQEIADAFHYRSLSTVAEILKEIERKGWVGFDAPNVPRALFLIEPVEV